MLEKGLSMKKIMVMALALMTAAVLATGCAGIGAPGKGTLVENSVMIEKDGNDSPAVWFSAT